MNTVFGGCKILLFLCFCSSVCVAIFAMKCPPCDKIHCNPRKASKLTCKGGVTTGVCGCCPVCARVEGERCGGYFNYLGKCDRGLYCEPQLKNTKRKSRKQKDLDGKCKKGNVLELHTSHFLNSKLAKSIYYYYIPCPCKLCLGMGVYCFHVVCPSFHPFYFRLGFLIKAMLTFFLFVIIILLF